ncbi:MAG: DUF481 domain-containing protein [Anaeromyxobacteraceae bacterium]
MNKLVAILAACLATATATGAAAQDAAAPKPPEEWKGTAGAGLILLTGNTSTITSTAVLGAKRNWSDWALEFKAGGVYGRTRPVDKAQDPQTVALAANSQLRGDRKFGEHLSVYALTGLDTDHVASVEWRGYGEGGLGYVWLNTKWEGDREFFLRTDLGLRYAKESRWQYYGVLPATGPDIQDAELLGPRAGLSLRWQNTKNVILTEDAEFIPNVQGDARYLVKSVTKLATRLSTALTFGVAYTVAFDSKPAPGKVNTDTILGVTLETAF